MKSKFRSFIEHPISKMIGRAVIVTAVSTTSAIGVGGIAIVLGANPLIRFILQCGTYLYTAHLVEQGLIFRQMKKNGQIIDERQITVNGLTDKDIEDAFMSYVNRTEDN